MRKLNSTNAINEENIITLCGAAYALSVISGRWKPSILWELFRKNRVRYSDFRKSLPNISERVLVSQLKQLEADRLILRIVYAEVPPRVEYELTALGKSTRPLLEDLSAWGEANKGS